MIHNGCARLAAAGMLLFLVSLTNLSQADIIDTGGGNWELSGTEIRTNWWPAGNSIHILTGAVFEDSDGGCHLDVELTGDQRVINDGAIRQLAGSGQAIHLGSDATITNNGSILVDNTSSAYGTRPWVGGLNIDFTNTGTIDVSSDTETTGIQAELLTLHNTSTGSISAETATASECRGVDMPGTSTVVNDGSITATGGMSTGIYAGRAATITNTGTIQASGPGAGYGIAGDFSGQDITITNSGIIRGSTYSIYTPSNNLTLNLEYGSDLQGAVDMSGTINLIDRGSEDESFGTMNPMTLNKTGTGTWTLSGDSRMTAINVVEGMLKIAGTLEGYYNIENGGAICGSGTAKGDVVVQSGGGIYGIRKIDGLLTIKDGAHAYLNDSQVTRQVTVESGGYARLDNTTLNYGFAASGSSLVRLDGLVVSPMQSTAGTGTLVEANGTFQGTFGMYGTMVMGSGGVKALSKVESTTSTFTVDGILAVGDDSVLVFRIDPDGNNDKIEITDRMLFHGSGGEIQIQSTSGDPIPDDTYILISAEGGVSGQAGSLTGDYGDLILQYTETEVLLAPQPIRYVEKAQTTKQTQVARVLDQAKDESNARMQPVLDTLKNLGDAQIRKGMDDLSGNGTVGGHLPGVLSGVKGSIQSLSQGVSAVGQARATAATNEYKLPEGAVAFVPVDAEPTATADLGGGWLLWGRTHGVFGQYDRTGNSPALDYQIYGVTVGADYALSPELRVGMALGYAHTDLFYSDSFGEGDIETARATLYARYEKSGFYADAMLGYGHNWHEGTRNLPTFGPSAHNRHRGYDLTAYLGGGYLFDLGKLKIGPTASVQYTCTREDGYTESGAGAMNLSVGENDAQSLQHSLGFRLQYQFETAGVKLTPSLDARWEHEYKNDVSTVDASLAGAPGSTFSLEGRETDRDRAVFGLGIEAEFSEQLTGYARYEAIPSMGTRQREQGISLGLRYQF